MLIYVQTLINIALRRQGPEDIPDSGFLLAVTVVAYLLLQLPLAWIAYGAGKIVVTTIGVSTVLLVVFVWALLRLTGFPARFRQTLTALFGTSALLSLASVPFSAWREATLHVEPVPALPSILLFAIMLWSLAIDGHILSRALSRPFAVGLVISIAYFIFHTTLLFELMPESITGPAS